MARILIQIILIGFLVGLVSACNALKSSSTEQKRGTVPLEYLPALSGDYFEFSSKSVGRPFHIYVRLPQDYSSAKKYPTVYILDGDSLFPILAANHLFLMFDYEIPDAIVVGISYGSFSGEINKRTYDFSDNSSDASVYGGAARFHSFLESELIPEIESRYNSDSNKRILFGQSRGGYMVLYSAFTDPDLFWGRIASNPSLQPGRERFFSSPSVSGSNDLKLMITSGSNDSPRLRSDVLSWAEHWQGFADLPWDVRFETIDGGGHASHSPDSYRIGLLWFFSDHK